MEQEREGKLKELVGLGRTKSGWGRSERDDGMTDFGGEKKFGARGASEGKTRIRSRVCFGEAVRLMWCVGCCGGVERRVGVWVLGSGRVEDRWRQQGIT